MLEASTEASSQDQAQAQDTSATKAAPDAASSATTGADTQASSSAPEKPAWLFDDALFDPEKGVKLEELGTRAKQLFDADAERNRVAEERKANTPEKPEDYGLGLPDDYKAPEGFEVDGESPLWGVLQGKAKELGLTRDEYGKLAQEFVDAMAKQHQAQIEAVKSAQTELFKQLGANGPARVEAVHKWMDSVFGDKAAQFKSSIFTPDIARYWESQMKSGSLTSFNGSGRETGSGKVEGYENMTFEQKWLHARKAG